MLILHYDCLSNEIWDTDKYSSRSCVHKLSPKVSVCCSLGISSSLNLQFLSFFFSPPLPFLLLPSTSSRLRVDAGKHFLFPQSYFLSLEIHFLLTGYCSLTTLSIVHTLGFRLAWLIAHIVCDLFSLAEGHIVSIRLLQLVFVSQSVIQNKPGFCCSISLEA